MTKLSTAQIRMLKKVEFGDGFLACMHADMRIAPSLMRSGLIAITWNDGRGGHHDGYVLTPAGHSALLDPPPQSDPIQAAIDADNGGQP
jgi:hypothetical protein